MVVNFKAPKLVEVYVSWSERVVRGKKNKTRSDIHIKRSWYVVDDFKAPKLVEMRAS